MKKKDFCQSCGKLIVIAKLKKLPHQEKKVCPVCYNKESNRLFLNLEPFREPVLKNTPIGLEKEKSLVRPAKFKEFAPILLHGESEVLRKKHNFDSFTSGKKKCEEIQALKAEVIKARKKKERDKFNEQVEQKKATDKQNKDFLAGLIGK